MLKVLQVVNDWGNEIRLKSQADYNFKFGFESLGWETDFFDYRAYYKKFDIEAMNRELKKRILKLKPDLVFIGKGEGIDGDMLAQVRIDGFKGKIVHWYGDARQELTRHVRTINSNSNGTDLFLHTSGGNRLKEWHNNLKKPTAWIPHPYWKGFLNPKTEDAYEYDTIFVGGLHNPANSTYLSFDPLRYKTLIYLNDKKMITLIGAQKEYAHVPRIYGDKYYRTIARAKINLNLSGYNRSKYFSSRMSHIMGSGAFCLTHKFIDLDKMFDDSMMGIFETPKDAEEKIKYY